MKKIMKTEPSRTALEKCAKWLSYCLSIGFKKSQLDKLEEIFWKFRDYNGNLK